MTPLNFLPIIGAVANFASSPLRYQLERKEIVIRLLKDANLSPDNIPPDFKAVYKHTLVEYSATKLKDSSIERPEILAKFFRQEDIVQAFHKAFYQNDQTILLEEGEDFLEWNILGDLIRETKINIEQEIASFKSIFMRVSHSTGNPFDVIQKQKIDELTESLENIKNHIQASPAGWNSYINFHGIKELVSFELENSPGSLGIAEPDDAERPEILLGQGFRLLYNLPFSGYALLLQGFRTSWVVTRLSKCQDSSLEPEARYIQERFAVVPSGRWVVPTNGRYLRERTDLGLHRFALLLTAKPFPSKIKNLVVQDSSELSSSTLNTLVEYIKDNFTDTKLIAIECDIVYNRSHHDE